MRAGWPQRTATLIGASVKYVVMGAATATFSGGFVDDPAIYAERYPHLTRAHLLRERAAEIDGASFELALESLLDGLDANMHCCSALQSNPLKTVGRYFRSSTPSIATKAA